MSDTFNDIHPLLLDPVLESVFSTLPLSDLLVCRLVCKTWLHNSSLKSNLKDKSTVCLRFVFLHTSTRIADLHRYFLSGQIYTRFHFVNIAYANPVVLNTFKLFGGTITSLKLHLNGDQLGIREFEELIYKHLPNLTELKIYQLSHQLLLGQSLRTLNMKHGNLRRLEIQELRCTAVPFMTAFLSTLPALEEICLRAEVCSDWIEQGDTWHSNSPLATSVIQALKDSKAFGTLKVLSCGILQEMQVKMLVEMGLNGMRLDKFKVVLNKPLECFNDFIKTQRKCLKSLSVLGWRCYTGNSHQICLPTEMQLEELHLCEYPKGLIAPLENVDISKQCPFLKKLVTGGNSSTDFIGGLKIPERKCVHLQELVLSNEITNPQVARILGESFVNLVKLTVQFPGSQFLKVLWRECGKLKSLELELEENEDMDEAITGRLKEATEMVGNLSSEWSGGITNLRNLERLKLIVWHDCRKDNQVVTDATVYLALKDMKHLRRITLLSLDPTLKGGLTECRFVR